MYTRRRLVLPLAGAVVDIGAVAFAVVFVHKAAQTEDAQLHDKRIMDGQPILLEERDNHGNFTFVSALRQNSSST